jgi:hypothetical protein
MSEARGHETGGHEGMSELLGSIANAAARAARPAGPAIPWRRGRRHRTARLAAQGAGALLLAGGLVAVPGLVADAPTTGDGVTASPSPSMTPAVTDSVPLDVPAAAVIEAQDEIWKLYVKVENARRCLLLETTAGSPDGKGLWNTVPSTRPDGRVVQVPDYRCEGAPPTGLRLDRPVWLLYEGNYGDEPVEPAVTELAGIAQETAARVVIELADGRKVELTGPNLPRVAGTSLRFFATKLRGRPRVGKLVAYRADGSVLGEDTARVDTSAQPPSYLTAPDPAYGGILDVRFTASASPAERTGVLVSLENEHATIEWSRANRYFLQAQSEWEPVIAILDAAVADGHLRYTVVQAPSG